MIVFVSRLAADVGVNMSALFQELNTKMTCCRLCKYMGWVMRFRPFLAQIWMEGMVEGRKLPAGTLY